MEEIVRIFMERDKVNRATAVEMFYDMRYAVSEAAKNDDLWEIDSTLADYGLEPDYAMNVIGY